MSYQVCGGMFPFMGCSFFVGDVIDRFMIMDCESEHVLFGRQRP